MSYYSDQAKRAKGQGAQARSRFVNFDRYFNANRDAANATAQGLAKDTQDKIDKSRAGMQARVDGFNGQSNPAAAPPTARSGPKGGNVGNVGNTAPGNSAGFVGAGALDSAPEVGPANSAVVPRSREELESAAKETYTGPTSLEDMGGNEAAYADSYAADQDASALGSEGGIQALLQRKNQNLTQGGSLLDAQLSGQAGNRDFSALRARFDPSKEWQAADASARQTAEHNRLAAEDRADKAAAELGGIVNRDQEAKIERDRIQAEKDAEAARVAEAGKKDAEFQEAERVAKEARRKHLGTRSWNSMNGLDEGGQWNPLIRTPIAKYWPRFTEETFNAMTPEERDELDDIEGRGDRGEEGVKELRDAFARKIHEKYGK